MDSTVVFWHWFVLGVVLTTIEMFVPGAFFLGMGMAAIIVGVVLWVEASLALDTQVLCFAVLSLVSVLGLRHFFKTRPIKSDQPLLNRRGEQYVGRHFTLAEPIINGRGKIRVDDSTWKIKGQDCEAGSTVTITGVDGVVLVVDVEA